MVESDSEVDEAGLLKELKRMPWLKKIKFEIKSISPKFSQRLSHQLIEGRFIHIKLQQRPVLNKLSWVKKDDIKKYPFPKFINQYLLKPI